MSWLIRDRVEAGVEIPEELLESFNKIKVLLLNPDDPKYQNFHQVLMGLRHVSGIKEWGGYQRAHLLVSLIDDQSCTIPDAARKISMKPQEAGRRYRAYKALKQMMNDEEFGGSASPQMYRLFHEAVAQPKIRDWLGWDDSNYIFTNEENRTGFYQLLTPFSPDEEDQDEGEREREPKIRTYQDVRNLATILGNSDAEECLLDPDQTIADALAIVKSYSGTNWKIKVSSASRTVENMTVESLKSLTAEEVQTLSRLYTSLRGLLEDWKKLTGNDLNL